MINRRNLLLSGAALTGLAACGQKAPSVQPVFQAFDDAMYSIIERDAAFEVLGEGYGWSEGPTWDRKRGALYFTDVPGNTAYRWRADSGVEVFLKPSGIAEAEGFREPGANGLWYAGGDDLIICNHGKRGVERMNLDTGAREMLMDHYDGKAFNSPNDVVQASDGTLYFTDPPYGLEGLDASPLKQQDANGVYRLSLDGTITRLLDDMTFPNGVALSPDETRLYISQSDPTAPIIRELTLAADGTVSDDRLLFDAKPYMAGDQPGLPDGMAVTREGLIFATGPGGVFVIAPDGKLVGRIKTGRATANCAFGEDGKTLFMTAHDRLLKLPTNVLGVQWI